MSDIRRKGDNSRKYSDRMIKLSYDNDNEYYTVNTYNFNLNLNLNTLIN